MTISKKNAFKCIEQNNVDALKKLIDQQGVGFVNSTCGPQEKSLLHRAVEKGHEDMINFLLENGANVDSVDKYGQTPLFYAVKADRFYKLLFEKSNVNHRRRDGTSVFMMAIYSCRKIENNPVIDFFVESKETDFVMRDMRGDTVAHLAIRVGNIYAFARIIKRYSLAVGLLNRQGKTPLDFYEFKSLAKEDVEMFKKQNVADDIIRLRTLNFENGVVDKYGVVNDFVCLRLWLLSCGDIDQQNKEGETMLHLAAKAGNLKSLNFLIAHGAKLNKTDNTGYSPLHCAILGVDETKILSCVMQLLQYNASANEKGHFDETPLSLALCNIVHERTKCSVVKHLVHHGADVNQKVDNWLPIDFVSFEGEHDHEILQLFLSNGCDLNWVDNNGENLAVRAAVAGNIDALKVLIKAGYNVNEQVCVDGLGEKSTILHAAAFSKKIKCVKWLIEHANADPDIANEHGITARKICKDKGIDLDEVAAEPQNKKKRAAQEEPVAESESVDLSHVEKPQKKKKRKAQVVDEAKKREKKDELDEQMERVKTQIDMVLNLAQSQCTSNKIQVNVEIDFTGKFHQLVVETVTVEKEKFCANREQVYNIVQQMFNFQRISNGDDKKPKVELKFAFNAFRYGTIVG